MIEWGSLYVYGREALYIWEDAEGSPFYCSTALATYKQWVGEWVKIRRTNAKRIGK